MGGHGSRLSGSGQRSEQRGARHRVAEASFFRCDAVSAAAVVQTWKTPPDHLGVSSRLGEMENRQARRQRTRSITAKKISPQKRGARAEKLEQTFSAYSTECLRSLWLGSCRRTLRPESARRRDSLTLSFQMLRDPHPERWGRIFEPHSYSGSNIPLTLLVFRRQ